MAVAAHPDGISGVLSWPERLKALLAEELTPRPRRFWMSLRLTAIATVGVGLIAICHVNGELGSYIVWLVVGAGPMMQVRKASAVLTAEAVMLAASVVMARALAETPWLICHSCLYSWPHPRSLPSAANWDRQASSIRWLAWPASTVWCLRPGSIP